MTPNDRYWTRYYWEQNEFTENEYHVYSVTTDSCTGRSFTNWVKACASADEANRFIEGRMRNEQVS